MSLPEWVPVEEWEAYLAMRKQMGKKHQATEYAKKLLVKRLDEFRTQGMDVKKILEQSIMRSWVGVFPVQPDRKVIPAEPVFDPVQRTKDLIQSYETSERIAGGYEEFRARMKQSNILKH